MKIIEYFSTEDKDYWLQRIQECDWRAGKYLYEILGNHTFKQLAGEKSKVLMLVDDKNLVAFCTFAEKDDIQPTDLTPWIGFAYTFPQYRGKRCLGELLNYAGELAKADGIENIYISTNHIGLYEKYGYEFFKVMKDIGGDDSRVYVRHI